jgi:hypothetical protein
MLMTTTCAHCGAFHWLSERVKGIPLSAPRFSRCCHYGKVRFGTLPTRPKHLQQLFTQTVPRRNSFEIAFDNIIAPSLSPHLPQKKRTTTTQAVGYKLGKQVIPFIIVSAPSSLKPRTMQNTLKFTFTIPMKQLSRRGTRSPLYNWRSR